MRMLWKWFAVACRNTGAGSLLDVDVRIPALAVGLEGGFSDLSSIKIASRLAEAIAFVAKMRLWSGLIEDLSWAGARIVVQCPPQPIR